MNKVKVTNYYVNCPYCKTEVQISLDNLDDMDNYGKTVFSCDKCNKLFTLRDDGDGAYIKTNRE